MNATKTPPGSLEQSVRIMCDHCGLVVPSVLYDALQEQHFCCAGCRVAYETIHGCGLDDFYKVRDSLSAKQQQSVGRSGRYNAYDSEAFQSKYVTSTSDGLQTVDLRLEGVHCAACVWLIERLPHVISGVIESRLSLATATATVTWHPDSVRLSQVAAAIDRLGYAPHPARDISTRKLRTAAERSQLVRLAVAGALAGNNMLIALALYAGVFSGIESQYAQLFRWLSMALGWISLLWPGRFFFTSAWSALRGGVANLDMPISLALGVGAIAGTFNVLLSRGEVYFDSLSALVFLLLVGRFFQSRQQRYAEDAVGRMLSLTPDVCRVMREGSFVEEPVEALMLGDEIEVRAGEVFPCDGELISGTSEIDKSFLTGESVASPITVGDEVCAGSQNVSGTVRIRASAIGEKTRLGSLQKLVEQGLRTKPQIVQFADRVAGWFLVAVLVLSGLNFAIWAATIGLAPAIDATVAMLIVACPCALGLATPLTMAVAIGCASKRGVLIKSSHVIEVLGRAIRKSRPAKMFLDKTGTLTKGKPRVLDWYGETHIQPYLAAIEADSNHPLGVALAEYCSRDRENLPKIEERVESHGKGLVANCRLGVLAVGSPRWILDQSLQVSQEIKKAIAVAEQDNRTCVLIAVDRQVVAAVHLADGLHDDASEAMNKMTRYGWSCEVLSGDNAGAVNEIASRLGLSEAQTHAEMTPEEKLQHLKRVKSKQEATLVMVGDGVNDAAALASADVGIAVHGGAEPALAAADVYIGRPGLSAIVDLLDLSKTTMKVIRRNLVLSLMYNTLAISLASVGWITPLVAAVLMPLSSATVVGSAIQGVAWRAK